VPVEIFFSYAHEDEALRDQLAAHLTSLAGVATSWYDRSIGAGTAWADEIDARLQTADIILLLVSADFLASDYCKNVEVPRALARHAAGEATVIPVILRACHWTGLPYGALQALPTDARPITLWSDRDAAWFDVVAGLSAAIERIKTSGHAGAPPPTRKAQAPTGAGKAQQTAAARIPDFLVVGFVARRDTDSNDIVARLQLELAPHEHRLVVLWGAGGVGKTTLAAEAARALLSDFNGRIVWTSALGRADYTRSTLLDEIAAQLDRPDLRPLAPEPKAEAVRALLADAPTLIILDNFETVGEAEQKLCVGFLHDAPAPALITTRQRIEGARNIPIAAMSDAEAHDYLRLLTKQTATPELFDELDHTRIITTAARNPLLLQWVVAQIEAAQDPTTVLDDLTHGTGDAANRVFTRSFNLPQLTDDGRAALLALSLFTPDAARASLAEVAGFDTDTRRLNEATRRLATLCLVKPAAAGKRLALEGLTRQLALARLQQDAHAEDYRRRFVAHFLRHAEAHEQKTPEDFDALEAELDNLLAAMDEAEGLRDWQSIIGFAWVLAKSVDGVLDVRGYWDEAIRCGEQGARAAEAAGDEYAAVGLAGNAASVRVERGEYEAARQTYERALAVMRRRGDEGDVAVALHQLGRIAQEQGEYAEAWRLYNESLEIKKKLSDQRGIAYTIGQLGNMAYDQGQWAEARRCYEETLKLSQVLGDQSSIAIALHRLAMLAEAQGELAEARRLYDESLEIEKKLGNQSGIASTLGQLGLLAEQEGDRAEAARLLREALRIFERLGSPYAEMARRILARVEGAGE
jgi:tetratricopeptide (TPR) repeat protein